MGQEIHGDIAASNTEVSHNQLGLYPMPTLMGRMTLERNTSRPPGGLVWKQRAECCSSSSERYPQAHGSRQSLKQGDSLQSVPLLSGGSLVAEAHSQVMSCKCCCSGGVTAWYKVRNSVLCPVWVARLGKNNVS